MRLPTEDPTSTAEIVTIRSKTTSSMQEEEDETRNEQKVQDLSPRQEILNEIEHVNEDSDGNNEDELPPLEDIDPRDYKTSLLSPCHFPNNHTFLSISKTLRKQAVAASITQAVGFFATTIALSAVGRHHSTQTLASCGIGISAFNVLSLSISVGWASAVDTLASNAFGRLQKGRGRIEEVGEITQIAMGTALILCLITGCSIFLFAGPIVRTVFGEVYVEGASEFLHHAFPYLIFFTCCGVLYKSLQAQHLAHICTISSWIGLAAIFIFSLILIPEYGVKGVAWSLGLSNLIQIFACLKLAPPKTTLFFKVPWFRGVTKQYLFGELFTKERVWEYTSVAIPTIFSVSAEWCVFELLYVVLIHSGAHEREVAAFSIFFNIAVLCWTFGSGTAVAAYSFVGKLLGEGKGQLALILGRTCVLWSWFISLISATLVCIFHTFVFGLYTKDPELMKELRGVLPLFILYHQGDNLQYTLQGLFRGAGKQDQTVKPVLLSLWAIALPSAFLATHFISASLHSLLQGFILGFVFEIPFLARKILQWDWDELAEEASRHKDDDDNDAEDIQTENNNDEELQVQQEKREELEMN